MGRLCEEGWVQESDEERAAQGQGRVTRFVFSGIVVPSIEGRNRMGKGE